MANANANANAKKIKEQIKNEAWLDPIPDGVRAEIVDLIFKNYKDSAALACLSTNAKRFQNARKKQLMDTLKSYDIDHLQVLKDLTKDMTMEDVINESSCKPNLFITFLDSLDTKMNELTIGTNDMDAIDEDLTENKFSEMLAMVKKNNIDGVKTLYDSLKNSREANSWSKSWVVVQLEASLTKGSHPPLFRLTKEQENLLKPRLKIPDHIIIINSRLSNTYPYLESLFDAAEKAWLKNYLPKRESPEDIANKMSALKIRLNNNTMKFSEYIEYLETMPLLFKMSIGK